MSTTALHPATPALTCGGGTSIWRRLWAALEDYGQRRAEAELRRLAVLHVSTDPELARHLRALAARRPQA